MIAGLDRLVLRLLGGRPTAVTGARLARLDALAREGGVDDWFAPRRTPKDLLTRLAASRRATLVPRWEEIHWESDCRPRTSTSALGELGAPGNATARASVRWGREGAPCVVLLHGHLLGDAALQRLLLPWRAAWHSGCTVALLTLPMHGARAVRGVSVPGRRPALNLEAIAQAVRDLLDLHDALGQLGTGSVRWVGQSLGGLAVTLAATERAAGRAAALSPLVSLAEVAERTGALGRGPGAEALRLALSRAYAPLDPTRLPSQLGGDAWYLTTGRDDAFASPADLEPLARHLGTPVRTHAGGHILPLGEGWSRRDLTRWLTLP